jgi:succinoglycan biosynthesis transport protein ExoP
MELKTYLAILWRRKWVILITTVVTVLVTAAGAFMMTPTYEASTTLRVAPAGASYTDFTYANQLKNTFIRIATSDLVLDEVAQRLGLDEPPKVKAEILGSSELMRLTVEHPNPRLAQEAANTVAEVLLDLHGELYVKAETTAREVLYAQLAQAERELNEARIEYESVSAQFPDDQNLIQEAASELELKRLTYSSLWERQNEAQAREALQTNAFSVFEPAALPENPAGLPKVLYVALGLMVGLTAGLGLAFLFENLDSTLHTAGQIEAVTQVSMLGKIPTAGRQQPIVFSRLTVLLLRRRCW